MRAGEAGTGIGAGWRSSAAIASLDGFGGLTSLAAPLQMGQWQAGWPMLLLPWRRCTVSTPAQRRTRCWGSAGGEALLLVGRWLAIFFLRRAVFSPPSSGGACLFSSASHWLSMHPWHFWKGPIEEDPQIVSQNPNCWGSEMDKPIAIVDLYEMRKFSLALLKAKHQPPLSLAPYRAGPFHLSCNGAVRSRWEPLLKTLDLGNAVL